MQATYDAPHHKKRGERRQPPRKPVRASVCQYPNHPASATCNDRTLKAVILHPEDRRGTLPPGTVHGLIRNARHYRAASLLRTHHIINAITGRAYRRPPGAATGRPSPYTPGQPVHQSDGACRCCLIRTVSPRPSRSSRGSALRRRATALNKKAQRPSPGHIRVHEPAESPSRRSVVRITLGSGPAWAEDGRERRARPQAPLGALRPQLRDASTRNQCTTLEVSPDIAVLSEKEPKGVRGT